MSHGARAKKRAQRRATKNAWDTVIKHTPYQVPVSHGIQTRAKSNPIGHPVIHRTHYHGQQLRFVGFGVDIGLEGPLGHGLRATMGFAAEAPITQYEGWIMTKTQAEKARSGPDGKARASHFASTSARSMVINGYSVSHTSGPSLTTVQGGVPLTRSEWRGRGGGSLCNHSETPNALLVRDGAGDGYGVYVVALRDIIAGQFIHVDYGKGFLTSNKTNL
jgi:SET domain